MSFRLTNEQRRFFGINPIEDSWEAIEFFDQTNNRPDSVIYFEGDILKRHIISNEKEYSEYQYNEETKNREYLLPKTKRGKAKKLTPSALESRGARDVYLNYYKGSLGPKLIVGNFNNQRTIYNSELSGIKLDSINELEKWINKFVKKAPSDHFKTLDNLNTAKKRRIKYQEGDIFSYRLDLEHFGFGRVLADLNHLREKGRIEGRQGINNIFGKPLLIEIYHHIESHSNVDIEKLNSCETTPQHYIQDNPIYYGEYEIIGNYKVSPKELDFPISFNGYSVQWGLIYVEKKLNNVKPVLRDLNKNEDVYVGNVLNRHCKPYEYTYCSFIPKINKPILKECIRTCSNNAYWNQDTWYIKYDLRKTSNSELRRNILKEFKLDPNLNYIENLRNFKKKSIFDKLFKN